MTISARIGHFRNQAIAFRKEPRKMLKQIYTELFKTGKKPFLFLIGAGIIALIIIPIITYLIFVWDLSSKESIMNRKSEGVVLLDRNEEPFFSFYQGRTKKITPLATIPEYTQQAIIAIEDREFYNHPGFSLRGIGRAVVENLRDEALSQGGSTITQQLVKQALLTPDRNFLRKYQEIVLALEIDRRFSKNDILEMYLNTSYFGEGAYGIEDAAQAYFSKPASELTLAESALLAGVLPAPSAYSPLTGDQKKAFSRQRLVLSEMEKQGYITATQRQDTENQEIVFNPKPNALNDKAPHFALMVKDELIDKYGEQRVARSGFKVKTTIDLDFQEYAETTVQNQVARLSGNKVSNGATIAINPKNGEILALVGSHDYYDEDNGKINMVVRSRQPGSSFKPIVYAKALLEEDITPATQLDDKAITFPGGYKPKNYDGRFRNEVLVRYALANSLNIPVLHVLDMIGIPAAIAMAEDLGINTLTRPDDYGLSLALGAAEVPLIQMASAFGTFANEGQYIKPTTIMQIQDKKNKVIYTNVPQPRQAIDARVAYQISSILSDNKARSEVFGGSLTISRPAAVKTGTTEDYRDALTIGYTPSLVVGVWVGNNDNSPMTSIAGSSGAAPIWRQMMEYYLKGTPVEQFKRPLGVLEVNVCRENGLRAEVATSSAYPEFFLTGTAPKQKCNAGPSVSPTSEATPTLTEDEEKRREEEEKRREEEEEKRQEEEERKSKEEENRNKPTDTPTPTPTAGTELTPTPIVIQLP